GGQNKWPLTPGSTERSLGIGAAKTGPSTGSGLRVPGHEMMRSLPTQQAWAADFAEIRTFFNSL
ncbi:hypothetical protein, partial [Thiolapillus sp.]|uniref:hypothetical protein n=1 Tax=Thiolapillus sp. TaxID=2017437 RepID=UPI0025F1E3EB